MQFLSTMFAAAALATLTSAGSITFKNQDNKRRTIVFTPNDGQLSIPDLIIEGFDNKTQAFPHSWIGNFYSVSDGQSRKAGILGEVRFHGYAANTYYDVSAIVNEEDNDGVKKLHPAQSLEPVSGCNHFPCSGSYYKNWDDLATLSTPESELVCLLGTAASQRRGVSAMFSRDYVTS